MSLAFSDTTNKDGIIQRLEQTLYGENGDARISGNSTLLAMFTGDINQAHDDALSIILGADGTWQFDDTNHTDYPIITTNIVSGQRDYPFTSDENSNLILEVHKIVAADSSGTFHEMKPLDSQTTKETTGFWDGTTNSGVPLYYDKTANAVFLEPVPNYNYTNGLKFYISREGSYFATSDTTKTPGIAGIFHDYYVIAPAYRHAIRKNMKNMSFLRDEKIRIEAAIKDYYSRRNEDVRKRLVIANHNNR